MWGVLLVLTGALAAPPAADREHRRTRLAVSLAGGAGVLANVDPAPAINAAALLGVSFATRNPHAIGLRMSASVMPVLLGSPVYMHRYHLGYARLARRHHGFYFDISSGFLVFHAEPPGSPHDVPIGGGAIATFGFTPRGVPHLLVGFPLALDVWTTRVNCDAVDDTASDCGNDGGALLVVGFQLGWLRM